MAQRRVIREAIDLKGYERTEGAVLNNNVSDHRDMYLTGITVLQAQPNEASRRDTDYRIDANAFRQFLRERLPPEP